MTGPEIQSLAERARAGDADALARLSASIYPDLLRYMRYRVGPGSAEDLAGDVFVRLVRSIRGQNGSFLPWLFRIAGNVVRDHHRARKGAREAPMGEGLESMANGGDDLAEAAGRRLDLESALGRLTGDQRQVVALRFVQGLSTIEAAEVMDRTPGAVRVLQFRALNALRELLGAGRGGDA